jgi:hypothetical protein
MWLASRPRPWLRIGDLAGIMFIWIGGVRFLIEFLRIGNWRIADIPTAQLFGLAFVLVGIGILAYRRRIGQPQLVPAEDEVRPDDYIEPVDAEGAGGNRDDDFDDFEEFDAARREGRHPPAGSKPGG